MSARPAVLPEEPTGTVPTDRGAVAYWRIGTSVDRAPLVCLHGGPGMPSAYLAPLAALADRREVIFYDQSGCGRSTRRQPEAGWTVQTFVEELHTVVEHLGLDGFHLFGNSWGGWLALEYVLSGPVKPPLSLVLSSSPPSVAGWIAEVSRLRAALPADIRDVLDHHERAGSTDTREYRRALAEFNTRHMCRISPPPAALRAAIAGFGQQVYTALWGDSEFGPVTGVLRGWDVTDRLPQVTMPTLVTGGRYDEAATDQLALMVSRLPAARLRIFPESSHMAFLEEPVDYVSEVGTFLTGVDSVSADATDAFPHSLMTRSCPMNVPRTGSVGPKNVASGHQVVCSSAHPLVTDAMMDTLRTGGNAIDAAIAGSLLNATVQQEMTSHAGTVTMIFWHAASGRSYELNSMGTIVPGLAPFRPVAIGSGPYTALPSGPCAVIPGFMPGLKAMHERFASRPWDQLCAPAVHWAEVGHQVDSFEHLVLGHSAELCLNTASGRAHFTPDGHLPPVGSRWPKPELAALLRRLAAEGPDLFTEGDWARTFVARANELGWPIEMAHLRQDEPRWGEGLRYRLREVEIIQQAPPERQAVMSAMVLGIMQALDVASLGHYTESAESLYYMAHALRRAAYETGFINDPAVFEDPSSVLMSAEFHRALAAVIKSSRSKVDLTEHVRLTSAPGALTEATGGPRQESVGSCELSAVDADGNWVQLVNTVQGGGIPGQVIDGVPMIGSTMTSSLTGVLGGWLTGGGRIRSVVGNTLILRDGQPWLSLGTPGIPHITVPQVLTSILEHGFDPYAADDAPRMMPLDDDYSVSVESRIAPEIVREVAKMGVLVRPMDPYKYQMGSFHMCWRDADGLLHSSAGPRRAGEAAGR